MKKIGHELDVLPPDAKDHSAYLQIEEASSRTTTEPRRTSSDALEVLPLRHLNAPVEQETENRIITIGTSINLQSFAQTIIFWKEEQKRLPSLIATLQANRHYGPLYLYKLAEGFQFLFTTWPWLLYPTIIRDLIVYAMKPESRYGTSRLDILLGKAGNQATYSTNWGSDLPPDPQFIAAYTLFLGALAACVVWPLSYLSWRKSLNPVSLLELKELTNLQKFFPGRNIARIEWELLWNRSIEHSLDRQQLYDSIIDLLRSDSFFVRARALHSMRQIAAAVDNTYLYSLSAEDRVLFSAMKENALLQLKQYSKNVSANVVEQLYSSYLLWTLGQSKSKVKNAILGAGYLSYVIAVGFGVYRYFYLLLRKSWEIAAYFHSRTQCQSMQNIWQYMEQIADYACTVCGDWPFVYYGDMNSKQGCLTGLLSANTNITAYDLNRLVGNDTLLIDLSRQQLASWEDAYFEQVFDRLSIFDMAQTLKISSRNKQAGFSTRKSIALGRFIQQMHFQNIELIGQGVNATQAQVIFNALQQLPLLSLNLANNNLGDSGAFFIAQKIQNIGLRLLDFSFNQINSGISSLSGYLDDIVTLVFKGVNFDQISFDTFIKNVTTSNRVAAVDISESTLAAIDMSEFSSDLANSSLKIIRMDGCQLSDYQLYQLSGAMPSSNLREVSVARNYLSDQAAIIFIESSINSSLEIINLSGNQLSDSFLAAIVEFLPNANFSDIDLSYNSFTSNGYFQVITNFPSSLQNLNVSHTAFSDDNLMLLGQSQQQNAIQLRVFDVSYTLITDFGVANFSSALSGNSSLTNFIGSGNSITNQGIASIAQAVRSNSQFRSLALTHALYNQTGAEVLVAATTHLQSLAMDNVLIGDAAAIAIGKTLTTPIYNANTLAGMQPPVDVRRALAKAKPVSALRHLSINSDGLSTGSALFLCRLLPFSNLTPEELSMLNNNISSNVVDLDNCVVTSHPVRKSDWQRSFARRSQERNKYERFNLAVNGQENLPSATRYLSNGSSANMNLAATILLSAGFALLFVVAALLLYRLYRSYNDSYHQTDRKLLPQDNLSDERERQCVALSTSRNYFLAHPQNSTNEDAPTASMRLTLST